MVGGALHPPTRSEPVPRPTKSGHAAGTAITSELLSHQSDWCGGVGGQPHASAARQNIPVFIESETRVWAESLWILPN